MVHANYIDSQHLDELCRRYNSGDQTVKEELGRALLLLARNLARRYDIHNKDDGSMMCTLWSVVSKVKSGKHSFNYLSTVAINANRMRHLRNRKYITNTVDDDDWKKMNRLA